MAVFRVYFDASGDPEDANIRVLAVAGWISTERKWEHFEREWAKALKDENLTMLHMRECAHWQGEFASWNRDEARRKAFLERLTKIMKRWTHQSFAVSLVLDDYRAVNRLRRLEEKFGRPYTLAAAMAVTLVNIWMENNHPRDIVLFVFERGDLHQGDLIDKLTREGLVHSDAVILMDKRIAKGDSVYHCEPLQASDFIAYEHAKAATDYFYKGKTKARGTVWQIGPRQRSRYWRFLDRGMLELLHVPKR